MKLNPIKTIIAICTSALIAFGFYSFNETEKKLLLGLGSFIFVTLTLIFSLSVSFSHARITAIIRIVSGIFFLIICTSNLAFSLFIFSPPIYFISNGLLLMVYALISYSISSAKQ
jgi:hypothetical protein